MGGKSSSEIDVSDGLTFLSWNIAGLHPFNMERAEHIGREINKLCPDVVLLQEVISGTLAVLQKTCKGYNFSEGKLVNYFNVLMTKKGKFKCGKEVMLKFDDSVMGRYLLHQELNVLNFPLIVMVSHLESLENFSTERKKQLSTVFSLMKSFSSTHNVIFAGDTNLREHECDEIGGVPSGILDAWETCGRDELMKRTKVIQKPGDELPLKRYDRLYCSLLKDVTCEKFELIGNERIEALGLYPSDHLGILVKFKLS